MSDSDYGGGILGERWTVLLDGWLLLEMLFAENVTRRAFFFRTTTTSCTVGILNLETASSG